MPDAVLALAPLRAPLHADAAIARLLARHRSLSYGLQVLCGGFLNNDYARALPALEAELQARGIPVPEYR